MWEKLKGLIDAVTLTRLLVTLVMGFAFRVMLILTLEFAGIIDIDMQCREQCMHLIDDLFSLVKGAKAGDLSMVSPNAPLVIRIELFPSR